MFGFGFHLGSQARGGVAPPPPAAAVTSLEVLGPAPLPDGADAAVPNGWVARVTLPDDSVSAFDPGKIVLTVSDPGFDGTGAPTVVQRTVRGTQVLRRQQPNQAQRLNSASGGVRTVYIALSDEVYAGTAIVSASAAPGYYGAARAGAVAGAVNGSTLAYPRPLFGWLNLQHERAAGTSFAVEAVAYHRHARNGRQVAVVRFQARDAQAAPNLSPAIVVGLPELSALQTGGNIVEAWRATLDLSGLAQGDLAQVNARVYPWIGDASAVLDTSDPAQGAVVDVTPGSAVNVSQGHTPLRFAVDRTGGYGGGEAWVRVGASGGAVGSAATPYATIDAALAALVAWNGANKGHADHSGSTVWLMDDGAGGAVDHVIPATSSRAAGKCWTDIRVAAGAAGQVRVAVAANVAQADLLRFRCPIVVATGGTAVSLNGGSLANLKRIAFDGASVTYTATGQMTGFCIQWGLKYWRNTVLSAVLTPFYPFSGNTRESNALILGCTGSVAGQTKLIPNVCVGNVLTGPVIDDNAAANANALPIDGGILANNRFLNQKASNALGTAKPLSGFARVQNVFEMAGVASAAAWAIGNDGNVQPIANFVSMHNTVPGVGVGSSNIGRQNAVYADVAGAAGVQKTMVERFDLLHQRNCKTDTFIGATTATGRTGNWRYRYGVGNLGVVAVTGDATAGLGAAADPSGGNWSGEYLEPGSTWAAGEANVGFVDNKAGTAGAGGGDYRLSGAGNAAFGRVPAGLSVLRFDLGGGARRQDGTGAAGAYERTG